MSTTLEKPYRITPPEIRNSFPESWRGMDLRGKAVGSSFIGCTDCGVEMTIHGIHSMQCPICTKEMQEHKVTVQDLVERIAQLESQRN